MRYRRRRRSLSTIIPMLLFSITLLASSTYAWFNLNRQIDASGVEIRVSAINTLKVSADAREFKSSITYEDIVNADYVVDRFNSLPTKFNPVSTAGIVENGQLKMFHGKTKMDRNPDSPNYGKVTLVAKRERDVDGTSGKYLAYDMYLKNDANQPIYLSNRSTVEYRGGEPGIRNAIRLAFINEGVLLNGSIQAIQSIATNDSNNVVIWEPYANLHTNNGIESANKYYNLNIQNGDDALPYLGIKNEILDFVAIDSKDESYFGSVRNLITTTSDYDTEPENQYIFTLPTGISKVRVYAWVEGQDVDCENMLVGSTFVINLVLTTSLEAR